MKDREDCMFSSISITVRYYLVSREKKKTGRLFSVHFRWEAWGRSLVKLMLKLYCKVY